jgi:hypothetical protein
MEFDPDNEGHWVYLAKAIDWSFGDEGGNVSDEKLISATGNDGLLSRSTLTHFRLQVRKTHSLTKVTRKLNNDVARRIWNYFIKRNNNPHVNSFSANIDFEKYKTYLGILSFFGSHPSKNKSLSRQLTGRYLIYSRSEMFPEDEKITRGILDFTSDADGLVIQSSEWHKYNGGSHGGAAVINHYFDGYVVERHSQIFVFSKSRHRSTPKFMIIDKRWSDQDTGLINYAEGFLLKGSFGSSPFLSRVYLVRSNESNLEPEILDRDQVDSFVLHKVNGKN